MPSVTAFFRRPDVWLLLLLGGSAALWVLTDSPKIEGDPEALHETQEGAPAPPLVIQRCVIERDYGNARLDIELRCQNISPRPLVLQPPDVRLLTAEGRDVPAYILPTESPPQIPARTALSVRLRYWLEAAHLLGPLTLDIRGNRAEVKSTAPLDLKSLENQRPKTWDGPIH